MIPQKNIVSAHKTDIETNARPGKHDLINNKTLIFVRWMAVLGQSSAILFAYFILGISIPFIPVSVIIFASVFVNIIAQITFGYRRLPAFHAFLFMAFDIIQLAALLWFTGGLENPFAMMILAPAAVAATLLPLKFTLWLIFISLGCIAINAISGIPLTWPDGLHDFPSLYIEAQFLAIALSLIFVCLYIWRMSSEARQVNKAYEITQLALAKQQRSQAIGALSAAAAHELGGPLSTISIISKDLYNSLESNNNSDSYNDDIQCLHEQVQRCRTILSNIGSTMSDQAIKDLDYLSFDILMRTIADTYTAIYPDISYSIKIDTIDAKKTPYVSKTPILTFGIGNILQNAFKFARKNVDISIFITEKHLDLIIEDDGPGFTSSLISRLGEPMMTDEHLTQDATQIVENQNTGQNTDQNAGMGLGIFIAQTLLSSYKAELSFKNANGQKGAHVSIRFPRAIFDDENSI